MQGQYGLVDLRAPILELLLTIHIGGAVLGADKDRDTDAYISSSPFSAEGQ
jgi:hypothetical protein